MNGCYQIEEKKGVEIVMNEKYINLIMKKIILWIGFLLLTLSVNAQWKFCADYDGKIYEGTFRNHKKLIWHHTFLITQGDLYTCSYDKIDFPHKNYGKLQEIAYVLDSEGDGIYLSSNEMIDLINLHKESPYPALLYFNFDEKCELGENYEFKFQNKALQLSEKDSKKLLKEIKSHKNKNFYAILYWVDLDSGIQDIYRIEFPTDGIMDAYNEFKQHKTIIPKT